MFLLFRYSVVFRLFRQCSVVPPVFRCSASVSVPVFRQRSGVPCSLVLCSSVPGLKYAAFKEVLSFSQKFVHKEKCGTVKK